MTKTLQNRIHVIIKKASIDKSHLDSAYTKRELDKAIQELREEIIKKAFWTACTKSLRVIELEDVLALIGEKK